MSFNCQIDKIDKAKEPAPAEHKEQNEYDHVNRTHRSEHNRKPYKKLYYPSDERNDKQNYLQKPILTVKPFIKVHTALLENNFFSLLLY